MSVKHSDTVALCGNLIDHIAVWVVTITARLWTLKEICHRKINTFGTAALQMEFLVGLYRIKHESKALIHDKCTFLISHHKQFSLCHIKQSICVLQLSLENMEEVSPLVKWEHIFLQIRGLWSYSMTFSLTDYTPDTNHLN